MATVITRTAMTDDDGTGTTGTIINNAWKTQLYDQIDALLSGAMVLGNTLEWGGGASIPDSSKVVLTNTTQTISGAKTFSTILTVTTSATNSAKLTQTDTTNGYGVVIEAEGTAATRYALIVRNVAGSVVYGGISTATGQVGYWGIGVTPTGTLSARLQVRHTTEQVRVEYDVSNYVSVTVGSTGTVTFNAVGAGAGFVFSDSVTVSGGLIGGAPTGGDKGAGTANFAGDVYKNNAAYTNPDYAFEHWATGAIARFADNEGAKNYQGLMPLPELEAYVRSMLRFPQIDDTPMGAFKRADVALELIEQAHLYLFNHEARLAALEARAAVTAFGGA